MTVDEYFAYFNELASHVTDRNLLGTDLAHKFERGLSYAILFKLPPGDANDLDNVFTRAGQAERILKLAHEVKKETGEKPKAELNQPGHSQQKKPQVE